jgi:hypothetical protein
VLLLVSAAAPAQAPTTCPTSHVYLGNYPKEKDTAWSEEAQGLANDSANWFVTQKDALWKFPASFDLSKTITGPDPAHGILRVPIQPTLGQVKVGGVVVAYNHFGDLDYYNGFLFVPVEGSRKIVNVTVRLPPVVAVFRASDLSYVGRAELPRQRGAGWIAIGRPQPLLYTSNSTMSPNASDPKAGPIFRYSVNFELLRAGRVQLTFVDRFPLADEQGRPLALDVMQGGVFSSRGCLYLVNGFDEDFDAADGGISVVDTVTRRRVAKSTSGSGLFNYEFHPGWSRYEEPEGIDLWDLDGAQPRPPGVSGQLHVLMLDNDSGGDDIYIKHYRVR